MKCRTKQKIKKPEGSLPASQSAFSISNYLLIGASYLMILSGFILMSGEGSTSETFNPDIFSTRRICIAPIVTLSGFLLLIYGILRNPHLEKG